jgi:hypothetical protein
MSAVAMSLETQIGFEIMRNIEARKVPERSWYYDLLSKNRNITMQVVKAYPDKPWNYRALSSKPDLEMDFVLENMGKDWDFKKISSHPELTRGIIYANQHKDWDSEVLLRRFRIRFPSPSLGFRGLLSAGLNLSSGRAANTDSS